MDCDGCLNVADGLAGDTANGGADADGCSVNPGDTIRSCETLD
jgi:hypothetical protein